MNVEDLAHALYDSYCDAVGGVAFNGDPLPTSAEFFADTSKQKQVAAWITVASKAVILLTPRPTPTQRLVS